MPCSKTTKSTLYECDGVYACVGKPSNTRQNPLDVEDIKRRTHFRMPVKANDEGPKWVEMPSVSDSFNGTVEPGESYHDLGMRYPDAPIPRTRADVIVHRATLEDVTGISQLMDWVSDGDIVIVEMTDLMSRDMELGLAVGKI